MKRIDTATRAVGLFGPGKDGFRDGDLANGVAPTDLNAGWFNNVQEELANVIESTGAVLNPASGLQLLEALYAIVRQGGAPGQVALFAQSTPPSGWMKANGAVISRTVYPTLFNAIGTYYGPGDGATTFKVPELRGEFLRALDDGRGVDPGRVLGLPQAATIVGGYDDDSVGSNVGVLGNHNAERYGADNFSPSDYPNALAYYLTTGSSQVGTAFGIQFFAATRPRNVALLACIKF